MDVHEVLQGIERRLILRTLKFWRECRGDRPFVAVSDIVPEAMPDIWPHCFVMAMKNHHRDPVFRLVGSAFALTTACTLENRGVSQIPTNSLAHVSTLKWPSVIDKQAPVAHGGVFPNANKTLMYFRSILLPLSINGNTVTGLLGAANCLDVPMRLQSKAKFSLEEYNL